MRFFDRFSSHPWHCWLRALVGVVASVLGVVVLPLTTAAGPANVSLVSAGDSRVVFDIDLTGYRLEDSRFLEGTKRLDVPGFGSFSEPGEPRLPARDFLVALPPQGGYRLSFTVQSSQALGRHRLEPIAFPVLIRGEDDFVSSTQSFRIDEAIYSGAASALSVTAEAPGQWRYQRVLPVRVQPVTYDPSTGETLLATRIRVEVTFSSGGRGPLNTGTPVREAAVWDRIFSRVLVNSTQAGQWRAKPMRPAGVAARSIDGPHVKLKVRDTGLHRVRASSAIGKGLPAGTDTSNLRLFKRTYDENTGAEVIVETPYRVIEDGSGTGGEFDGADYLLFYGQRLREDSYQSDPFEKFSDHNIYWLGTTTASQGVQIPVKNVPVGTVSPDTATTIFAVSRHFEEDLFFMEMTPPGIKDFYYFYDFFAKSYSTGFSLGAIDTGGTFELRAEFLGTNKDVLNRDVILEIINSNGTFSLPMARVPRTNVVQYTSGQQPANVLVEGSNTLRILPTSERTIIEAVLNWFKVEYPSPFSARGNVLAFNCDRPRAKGRHALRGHRSIRAQRVRA
jgi:hypothetical protein